MKRPIKGTHVIDIDAVNENFLSISEESTGYLNEHNFTGPGLNSQGNQLQVQELSQLIATRSGALTNQLPEDIAYRLHYSVPTKSRRPDDLLASNWTNYGANDFYVTQAIPGFSMTRTFVGGVVWVCCSFTLHNHKKPAFSDLATFREETSLSKGFGFNVALEIDGAIVPESLVGTGDITQENFMNQAQTQAGNGRLNTKPKGGGGINGARNAVVVDAVVNLTPGRHTIRLALQDIRSSNGAINSIDVSTIELFALEIMG